MHEMLRTFQDRPARSVMLVDPPGTCHAAPDGTIGGPVMAAGDRSGLIMGAVLPVALRPKPSCTAVPATWMAMRDSVQEPAHAMM